MSKEDPESVDPIDNDNAFHGASTEPISAVDPIVETGVDSHLPMNTSPGGSSASSHVADSQDQVSNDEENNLIRLKSLSLEAMEKEVMRSRLDSLQVDDIHDSSLRLLQPSPPNTSSHSMNIDEHYLQSQLTSCSKLKEITSNNEIHESLDVKRKIELSDNNVDISNNNNKEERESSADEKEFAALLAKRDSLLKNLRTLQTKRNRINTQSSAVSSKTQCLHKKLNHVQVSRDAKIQTYTSLHQSNVQKRQLLKRLQQTNVLQDCFWISTRGEVGGGEVYATINGLRLGLELPPTFDLPSVSAESSAGMGINFDFLWGNGGDNMNSNSAHSSSSVGGGSTKPVQSATPPVPPPPVSWPEVNAALGTLALCLHVIHERIVGPLGGRYLIQPRGSTSRISSVVGPGGSGSNAIGTGGNSGESFELFYNPVRFSFFTRRNFNTALGMLGYCLWEVGQVFSKMSMDEKERRDRRIDTQGQNEVREELNSNGIDQIWSFPYKVVVAQEGNVVNGGVTVGGMELSYNGDGILWTKVMRFFALNVKWCMVFMAKKNLDV
jgi:hypothetical protein